MDFQLSLFSENDLPAFKIGDVIIFMTPETRAKLIKIAKGISRDEQYDGPVARANRLGQELINCSLAGRLRARHDDYLVVENVQASTGELHEQPVHRVTYDCLVLVGMAGRANRRENETW